MSRLINFIIEMYTEYNSFSNYYIRELSSDVSIFQLINFIILIIILFYYGIKCLLKRFKLYSVLVWICKQLIISFICMFMLYYFSETIVCDSQENKNLNFYFDQLDSKTKKYIGIACITLIGSYCAYKYIPLLYKKVYIYNLELLPENYPLNRYQLDLIKFHDYWTNNKFTSNQLSIIYRNHSKNLVFEKKTEKFNTFVDLFKLEHHDKMNGLLHNLISPPATNCNTFLNEVGNRIIGDGINLDLQNKLDIIYVSIKENHFRMKKIIKSGEKYNISTEYILLQYDIVDDLGELYHLYLNASKILEPIYKLTEDGIILNEYQQDSVVDLIDPLDEQLDKIDRNVKLLSLKLASIENYHIPYVMFEPIFRTDSIDVLQVTGVSLGYVFFYPLLYCSNKILGTVNPLSSKAFYDALWYIFTLKFFF